MPRRLLAPGAFFLLAAIVGVATSSQYVLQQGTILWCYALAVIGLAFAIHVSGEFLLGQGAIFALSGYIAAVTTAQGHQPYLIGLLVGAVAGGLLGLVIGLGALRTSGWYFAMASFFLAAIVPNIIDYFPSLTGGDNGLFGVPVASVGGVALGARGLYFLVFACVAVCAAFLGIFRQTRTGLAMAVMRQRSAAAASLGFSPTRLRLIVFVVSSVPAGLGGAFYAHLYGFVQPTLFPLNQTILFFSAVVIGGRRLTGVLVGLTVLVLLPLETLGSGANNDIVYSAAIIIVAILIAQRSFFWTPLARRIEAVHRWPSLRRLLTVVGARRLVAAADVEVSPDGARASARLLQSQRKADAGQTLTARGVRVRFGSVTAVGFEPDDELQITAGRVHALLGANGSGKTTLLNAISGHVRSEGTVALDDRPLNRMRAAHRAREGLGRSWQSPALPQELTPVQLVSMALRALSAAEAAQRRPRRKQAEQTAFRALELGGLGQHAYRPVSELSSAQRRWLDLLVAISRPVNVVILDEPGAGLTRAGRAALAELVTELSSLGIGIVLIEHDLDLALRVADMVTVLDTGAPIYQGLPAGVRDDARVRRLFLGEQVNEDDSADKPRPSNARTQS
jgi:branched-chain amino acid transport system permease protein